MPLSRREYQVLQLIAEGLENAAVADKLYLSVETVRTHVKSILRKLGARDRTHAASKAFRSGPLAATPPTHTGLDRASLPWVGQRSRPRRRAPRHNLAAPPAC